jgi:hypothetical protein
MIDVVHKEADKFDEIESQLLSLQIDDLCLELA